MQSLVNDVIDLFAYTCNMADRESEKLGVKAFSVLKKGFTKLLDLPPGEICDFLYADDVITLEELENATNKHHSTKDRCRKLIVSLKRAAKRDHEHFERFCDYLIKENPSLGYSTMAAAMKEDFASKISSTVEEQGDKSSKKRPSKGGYKSKVHTSDGNSKDDLVQHDSLISEHMKRVQAKLAVLIKMTYESDDNVEAKLALIKEAVKDFIKKCQQTAVDPADIKHHLKMLCYMDVCIPTSLHDWCFECLKELFKQHEQQVTSTVLPTASPVPQKTDAPSLFNKEIVYHSMFLCAAVDTSDESNFERNLSRLPTGHSFEQISMSFEKNMIDRCIIAKKKKILFVVFRGEPSLHKWCKKYASFTQGIECQMSQMPVRFFAEQIRDGYQIVLTGFSFGGLLAVAITARIWRLSLIAVAELRKKVVCIAFGVPMLDIPAVSTTLVECPAMESIIHLIYLKDDMFPRLMRFMNLTRVPVHDPAERLKHLSIADSEGHTQAFDNQFIMDCLISLQNASETSSSQLAQSYPSLEVAKYVSGTEGLESTIYQLKALLKATSEAHRTTLLSDKLPISGVFHLIFADPSDGLIMHDLASHAALAEFAYLAIRTVDQLNSQLFKQHTVSEYQQRLFRSYLDQIPSKYSPPLSSRRPLEQVKILKPSVSKAEFHCHGNKIAIILDGDNLWFCHQVDVGSGNKARTIKNPRSDITRCSIMFDYTPESDQDNLVDSRAEEVQVTIHSHFTKPLRDQTVSIVCKRDNISLRQSQLAKHPPSNLIVLAFLSAMLEHPSSTTSKSAEPSKRYRLITSFLESAVRIVPIESICHAISSCDETVALKCTEALVNSNVTFPRSKSLYLGLLSAHQRMLIQFDPSTVTRLQQQALHTFFRSALRPEFVTVNVALPQPLVAEAPNVSARAKTKSYSAAASGIQHARPSTKKTAVSKATQVDEGSNDYRRENYRDLIHKLGVLAEKCYKACYPEDKAGKLKIIGGSNIEELYPLDLKKGKSSKLISPLRLLRDSRKKLLRLSKEAHTRLCSDVPAESEFDDTLSSLENTRMLETVNEIWLNELNICASLLGAFMQEQIAIPLVFNKSALETAQALYDTEAPANVGIWALFSLGMLDVQKMLYTAQGNTLLVQITNYVESLCSDKNDPPISASGMYEGKLQFLLQCFQNRVSCNTEYISYSLERQLASLCQRHKIHPSQRVGDLVKDWDSIFRQNALTLVAPYYRPLLARWLIWSLAVHQLREGLARYTTIGIIGLANSGKSKLVQTLFKREVLSGALELERTTVPFMYNLDDVVEGLSVIDFPGVDDMDRTIPALARLLLTLAQLVVLVVDFRKIHTESAMKWLEILRKNSVPYLVCLTHADKLYANHVMSKHGIDCEYSEAQRMIGLELQHVRDRLGLCPNRSMNYYSFCLDEDSKLNSDEGRQALKTAGICCPRDVGDWIESKLRGYLQLDDVASKLHQFLEGNNE